MCNVKVYAASAEFLADDEIYMTAYTMAAEARRKKADSFRRASDRRLSLCAGLLMRHALIEAGVKGYENRLAVSRYGKPYIEGSQVHFSISHSGEYAVCAVSEGYETGCDIEKITSADMDAAKLVFTHEECGRLMSCTSDSERNELFFRLWTLRESFVKAVGTGFAEQLSSSVTLADAVPVTLGGRIYSFSQPQTADGYRCAVCTASGSHISELSILTAEQLM